MDLTGVVLAPVRAGRLVARALDDLHVVAERARRDPDPVDMVRERLDTLIEGIDALALMVGEVIRGAGELTATGRGVDARAREVIGEASALRDASERLQAVGEEIVVGGRELAETGQGVDRRGGEIVVGGRDLQVVAESLDETLRVLRGALPRLLEGIATAEQLEDAVETVAETVEPLQGAAERVGRVTKRVGRSRK